MDNTLPPAKPAAPQGDAPSVEGEKSGAKIEGGYDAVVVGANIDGYVAACYLGRAGLKTVLLETGIKTPKKREFSPGYFADDGEFFVRDLDPDVIQALDLYRHGLCFAQRRFDSVYYFADKTAMPMQGDLYSVYEAAANVDEEEADNFQLFVEEIMMAAQDLRPFFDGGQMPSLSVRTANFLENYGAASLEQAIDSRLDNENLKAMLVAEGALHAGTRPSDPHSFMALVRRWSGEAAGLQAGCAFPAGGSAGVFEALRRAAQSAGVEIRSSGQVQSVLIEWDGAAGVSLSDGGQIRAPIVVNALNCEKVFLDQIGPWQIDIEFQKAMQRPRSYIGAAKVHFAFSGAPRDEVTKANLRRRLVYVPDRRALRQSYRMAREGEVGEDLILELTFPSAIEPGWGPSDGNLCAGWMHPLPYIRHGDEDLIEQIKEAALENVSRIIPGAHKRLIDIDVQLADGQAALSGYAPQTYAGAQVVMAQAQRMRAVRTASGIRGVFFCGPEAQIGHGASGAAGRQAGKEAVAFSKTSEAAA